MTAIKRVQTIPATLGRFTSSPIVSSKKRKVAGYARVSTDHDEQFTSYTAQVEYYTRYIREHDDWEFVNVYTDEGITGTSTKKREGFKQMIADALAGKIDLILTKSVSRFARNTVDSLTTIRKLKDNGTEVYFEKENIWTFDAKGEVLLTIMSSLAQEESRSISENCTWGQRKRFADGKVTVSFKNFLGYDRGTDGNLVVNQEQAKIVKMIYGLFLKGLTPYYIAKKLTDEKISSPGGASKWYPSTVRSILSNEKFKGDALLQKSFCEDFLTKKMKINKGEVPQYYVENNHEAIIDPQTFDMVQVELARRATGRGRHSGVHLFSGKIKCGDCGGWYGNKVWHSTDKFRKTMWQCNQKYRDRNKRCTSPSLNEQYVRDCFTKAVNQLIKNSSNAVEACEDALSKILDISDLEQKNQELSTEMQKLDSEMRQMIKENAAIVQDQFDFKKRYDEITIKFQETEGQKSKIELKIRDLIERRSIIENFIKKLKEQNGEISEFNESLWSGLLEYVTAYAGGRLVFRFKNGSEIEG